MYKVCNLKFDLIKDEIKIRNAKTQKWITTENKNSWVGFRAYVF